jgi:hypothetical protein
MQKIPFPLHITKNFLWRSKTCPDAANIIKNLILLSTLPPPLAPSAQAKVKKTLFY